MLDSELGAEIADLVMDHFRLMGTWASDSVWPLWPWPYLKFDFAIDLGGSGLARVGGRILNFEWFVRSIGPTFSWIKKESMPLPQQGAL